MYKHWLGLLSLFLFLPPHVFAVSTTIIAYPSVITEDSFSLTASISGARAGTNYLRIDLFLPNTSNYFGETSNGNSWYTGSDYSQYFPLTIVDSSPHLATISGKVGTPTIGACPGSGQYQLRVKRYTTSGSDGTEEVVPVTIQLVLPSPSPSPIASPMPSPIPSPSPSPSPSIALSPSSSPKPTQSPFALPSPTIEISPSILATIQGVATSMPDDSPTPSSLSVSTPPAINPLRLRIILGVGAGLISLGSATFIYLRKRSAGIMRE